MKSIVVGLLVLGASAGGTGLKDEKFLD